MTSPTSTSEGRAEDRAGDGREARRGRRAVTGLAALVAAALAALVHPAPAAADDLERELAAAARRGTIALGDLDSVGPLLGSAPGLRDVTLRNVRSDGRALTADVEMLGGHGTLVLFGPQDGRPPFIAFQPGQQLGFAAMFPAASGAASLDVLTTGQEPRRQLIALAPFDLALERKQLPALVRAVTDRLFEDGDYTLHMFMGLDYLAGVDLARSRPLAGAMKFLGGPARAIVHVQGSFGPNTVGLLLGKGPPVPSLLLTAVLPRFRPSIGGVIAIPDGIQLTLQAELTPKAQRVTFGASFPFQHAESEPPVELDLAGKLIVHDDAEPEFEFSASLANIPLAHAFGIPWLSIDEFKLSFGVQGPELSVGIGGTVAFGGKRVELYGQVAAPMGVPAAIEPQALTLEISDGPDRIGELSLRDLAVAYNQIIAADPTTARAAIPLRFVPDVAVTGTEVGKGPHVKINLEQSRSWEIDLSGNLRFLGVDVATIDTATLAVDRGLDIEARSIGFWFGPVHLPSAAIQVQLIAGKPPRLAFAQRGAGILGVTTDLALVVESGRMSLSGGARVGGLLQFSLTATVDDAVTSFAQLRSLEPRLSARLVSDPGTWLAGDGVQTARQELHGLTLAAGRASQDLDAARHRVDDLTARIAAMEHQVQAERAGPEQKLRDAEAEVDRLTGVISGLDGDLATLRGQVHTCDQTTTICLWYDIIQRRCTSSKTVPDLPARASCAWNNAGPIASIAVKQAALTSTEAALTVARKTLATVRLGITSIPIDLDPRVAALIAARDSASLALATAQRVADDYARLGDLLARATAAAASPGTFQLDRGELRGSLTRALRGDPVVLVLDYRLLGTAHRDSFAFELGADPQAIAYDARQLEVLALAAAVGELELAASHEPLVPYALVTSAIDMLNQAHAKAAAEAARAMHDNSVASDGGAAPSLGSSIEHAASTWHDGQHASNAAILDQAGAALGRARADRSAALIEHPGDLLYFRLDGGGNFGAMAQKIGSGWQDAKIVVAGAGHTLYAVMPGGELRYYRHDDAGRFTVDGKVVGSGWAGFVRVFAGPPGVLYAVEPDGRLLVYHHDADGRFTSSQPVGSGWAGFARVFSDGHGAVYAIEPDGRLLHYAVNADGTFAGGPHEFGWGWNARDVFAVGGGVIYLVDPSGDLYYYRHDSSLSWQVTHRKVGDGWLGFRQVFAAGDHAVYAIK